MYDIIIVGAGVIGTFVARTLSKYKLNVLVIEKESDVGDKTSCANSAIVHSGYDPHPNTLKAKLNVKGNELYDQVCGELDVEFERIGSLTIATTLDEVEKIDSLIKRAKENKVEVQVLDHDEIMKIEPNATENAIKAIYAKSAGIINPFELCVALMENAMDNGVELILNEEVINIEKQESYFIIYTNKKIYQSKIVINAAGIYADKINNFVNERIEINPRKGEYFVLDHFAETFIKHVLFTIPSDKGKGILITPTTSQNYLIGPSSDFIEDKEDLSTNKDILDFVMMQASKLVKVIPQGRIIRQFAGLRAHHEPNDFVINEKDGFINVLGIQSPGLASAPAISLEVLSLVEKIIKLDEKDNYNPYRRPLYRLNKKSEAERNQLIKENPTFGNMVCRCEQVSEGEVIDAIHRNCGATTIKGIKKRVRPGAGKCQGGFCEPLIMKILSRELNIPMNEIRLNTKDSYILLGKTKEGDEHE